MMTVCIFLIRRTQTYQPDGTRLAHDPNSMCLESTGGDNQRCCGTGSPMSRHPEARGVHLQTRHMKLAFLTPLITRDFNPCI